VVRVRLLKVVLVLAILAALAAAAVGILVGTPFGPKTATFVNIPPGTGTAGIARELQRAGVVRSASAFEAIRVWKGLRGGTRAASLKAGEYRFNHPATMVEVYDRIRSGDVYTQTVVIPEGFNIFDIANAMAGARLSTREAFLQAEIDHTELISAWTTGESQKPRSLEGFLFPDTYRFSPHATPVQILSAMVRRFGQVAHGLQMQGNVQRTVTMASLVEKEVHLDSERPVVASVFGNRLAVGMPLQTDPSVIYASLLQGTRGNWTGAIHESELHSDSAYNTYTHAGLPPGPICNPGLAALTAALHPARTDYLYFVADANGATRFAVTLAEHNANVASYRARNQPANATSGETASEGAGNTSKAPSERKPHRRSRKKAAAGHRNAVQSQR
jgi:UPF0755 protein